MAWDAYHWGPRLQRCISCNEMYERDLQSLWFCHPCQAGKKVEPKDKFKDAFLVTHYLLQNCFHQMTQRDQLFETIRQMTLEQLVKNIQLMREEETK